MAKIVSKKGKTFADVAKPIQNLIEKLKDRPKSQANDNTIMLLEKQLDDLFAKQEAIKEAQNPQPQQMQMPQQMPMEQPMGQEAMMGQPQQMPSPEEQAMMQGQPEMAYGGYLPKFFGGGIPYIGQVGTAYNDPNMTDEQVQNIRNNQYTYSQGVQDPFSNPIGASVQQANALRRAQLQGTPYTNQGIEDFSNLGAFSNTTVAKPIEQSPNFVQNQNNQNYLKSITNKPIVTTTANPTTNNVSAAANPIKDPQTQITDPNKRNPFDRWGEVGAIGTNMAANAGQMSNINAVKRPGILQNIYLTPGVAPDKIDYTAEQEALNTDIAAAREANKLAGGNPAVLGQLRAEQLRRRGQIAQGQENANTELMNQYKRERTEAMQKSQAANADIAKENMYNEYGYNQWLAGQRNAAIASSANTISGVFNNQTTLKNQLDVAQIMANAHPDTVWTDASGNKYVTIKGKNVPVTQAASTTQAAQPAAVAPATTTTAAPAVAAPAAVATPVATTTPTVAPTQTAKITPAQKASQMADLRAKLKTAKTAKEKNEISKQLLQLSKKADGGMIYADGGNVYKQKLGEVLSGDTISRAKQMDIEYAQALKNKQNTYTSSVTGLEYKVMPRSEKDLYAANLWKETHGTAPTKSQKEATKKAIEGRPTSSNKAIAAVQNSNNQYSPSESNDMFRMISDNTLGKNPILGSMGNRPATSMPNYVASQLGVGAPDVKGKPSSNKFRAGIENELAKKNARYDLSKGVSKWEKPNIAEGPKPQIQGQPWMGRVDQEQPIGKPSFKTETYGKDNTNVNMSPRAKGSGKATEAPIAATTRQAIQDIKSGSKNLPDVTANARMVQPNAEKAAAAAKKGYDYVNEEINDVAKTVVPTSVRALTKDIIRNNFGGNGEITEKDFTKSQLEAIRQLAQKKLELSKTKGSSTAVNSYNDYDKDLNGILSQWSANKNIRNTLGKFNPIQDGDTLRIKEKYNFNEKENDKVVKEYLEWKNYWRQKGYSRPLAYFRSAGSTWGSPGSEYGDDSQGTPINIKIYNPKKKKA